MQETKRMPRKRKPRKKCDARQSATPDRYQAFIKATSVLQPTLQAAVTLKKYCEAYGDLDLHGLVLALTDQTNKSSNGDLARAEAMLTAQAHTLDAIFNSLARQAARNIGEYMDACEVYLKLALRTQSQCRSTWEAVAAIKYPPVMGYIRQANIAHGPQQVNNASAAPRDGPLPRENPNPQNKLLEENDGERLDLGTAGTPGRADTAMETMGEVDGADDLRGKIQRR